MFGKKSKVEMPLRIFVSKIKVPQEYRCLKLVIKRGKKDKRIGVLDVIKGFVTVPANQAYEATGQFELNDKTDKFESKSATFEILASKNPKEKY